MLLDRAQHAVEALASEPAGVEQPAVMIDAEPASDSPSA